MEMGKTPSGTDGVLHHPPEAFERVEVMATMRREDMEAQRAVVVVEGRVQLVRPMDPAPIDDHHDLFPGCAEGRHDLMERVAQLLGITMGHDLIEHFGGPRLDRPDDTESHAAGHTAPGAIAQPGLAFEAFVAFALTLAPWAEREASAPGGAPPARAGQRKAPQARCVFREHNDLATARLVLEGSKFESAIGESSRGGIQSAGGAVAAHRVFFHTPRTRSRPSWSPVSRAKTVASARQLHWQWREPCSRGS